MCIQSLEKAHEALTLSTYPKQLFAGDPGANVSKTEVDGGFVISRLAALRAVSELAAASVVDASGLAVEVAGGYVGGDSVGKEVLHPIDEDRSMGKRVSS